MASGKCLAFAKTLQDHVAGAASYTPPATLYVALSTAAFTQAATGSAMTEVAGNNYARVALTNNSTNFPASSGGATPVSKSNGVIVNWPNPSGAWGTVTSWYICDSSSGGVAMFGADLGVTKAPVNGDTVNAAIGALLWTEQ